jgi:O-acetyl-ADP-ribose deacetylase (regulator of RNase III)
MKIVKGNLLDLAEAGDFDIVVQGCNCFNTMGGGIAREIRERYPEVAEVDIKSAYADYNKLGSWTKARVIRNNGAVDFTIINAYTQYDMSRGTDVFEYEAFVLILKKLRHFYPTARFGFPFIGMGLAGGDKNIILEILEQFSESITAAGGTFTLVEFEQK